MVASAPPHAPVDPARSTARRTGRRRGAPSGRAVVGGLLVAVAAVAAFVTQRSGGRPPAATVVVAAAPLPVGHRLGPGDLAVRPATLPADVLDGTYASVDDLVGAVTLAPFGPGDLVQGTQVRADAPPAPELSIAVERPQALDGDLRPGELVDVLATYGSGSDASTVVVARQARVEAVQSSTGGLGGSGALVLTLAPGTDGEMLELAHAAQVAALTVVRSTGSTPGTRVTGPGPSLAVDGSGR